MPGSITITQDSIVKVLIRRGTDSERRLTTLTEGELGYTIDTQRLFIGDGITLGGVPAGNKFLGITSNKEAYVSIAQPGDTIYQTGGGGADAEVLYANTGGTTWENVHPKPFTGLTNGFASLEKATNGKWRVAPKMVGGDPDETIPSGFTLVYDDTTQEPTSITQLKNRLDFDSRYISLCADTIDPFYNTSWYFGNINNRQLDNNLAAMVNIDKNLFINGTQTVNTFQLQIHATDPSDIEASSIYAQTGGINVGGKDRVSLLTNNTDEGYRLTKNGSTVTTTFSSRRDGTYGNPNFNFKGVPVFSDPVFFDTNANVTMLGNLSVFGDISYFETVVSTTSALSVINNNPNVDTFVVAQLNTGVGTDNQCVARFQEGAYPYSLLALRENQFAGFFVDGTRRYDPGTGQTDNFVVSGGARFNPHPTLVGSFNVDMHNPFSNINILGAGTVKLGAYPTGNLILSAGALGYVAVYGGINAIGGDVIAYFTSDVTLKDNITKIDSALDKVKKISGVNFKWKPESSYEGDDVGVLAQEIEEVLPSAVTTRSNGKKAVMYDKIIPLLIEAIKELSDKK